MVNILIADDNIYYTKSLINSICENNDCTRLCKIATDGKEVIESIKQNKIDVILLDIQMPQLNGLKILDILSKQYIDDYKDSVIVISNYYDIFTNIRNNPCVYSYINKIQGIDYITKVVQDLLELKEIKKNSKILENLIIEELKKLSYNFKYRGTKYLVECIMLIFENRKSDNMNLKKDIFPIIAKRNKNSLINIKININNATEMMYYDCNQDILNKYFGYNVIEKPKTKFVISTIVQKIYIHLNKIK